MPEEAKIEPVRFIEQRKAKRYPLDATVLVVSTTGETLEYRSQDISLCGIRLIGPREFSIPDDPVLRVALPGFGEFHTRAHIVWSVRNEVFGVEFDARTSGEDTPLPAFIRSLDHA